MTRWRAFAALLIGAVELVVHAPVSSADQTAALQLQRISAEAWRLPRATSAKPNVFRLSSRGRNKTGIRIFIYTSAADEIGPYDNNCVASSKAATITCDLSYIDNFIAANSLMAQRGGSSPEIRRRELRQSILKWILAHELGHIVLGHPDHAAFNSLNSEELPDASEQERELAADTFAQSVLGSLSTASDDYYVVLDVANAAVRRALCPESFPSPCEKLNYGVGLIFNSAGNEPIVVSAGTTHPDFMIRFLRLLYLAGLGTDHNSINYLAKIALDKIEIQGRTGINHKLKDYFAAK